MFVCPAKPRCHSRLAASGHLTKSLGGQRFLCQSQAAQSGSQVFSGTYIVGSESAAAICSME